MKFTLSWLKEHLDTNWDLNKISSTLTNIGLEVESITDRSEELAPFKVAKVLNAYKHPNADKLKVCEVKSDNGTYQVVCGAPNAKTGMLGIFAPENSFIPGTKLKLKKTKIRDVESCGMLVSEREMGISDEHEGIIEVDQQYKIGDSFSVIYGLNDPIIEINITPNRSDCLSVRGIARDLQAAGAGKLKELKINITEGDYNSPIKWLRKFNKTNEKLCPGVSGRFFKNVKNTESPDWLKNKLLAIGLRPISALVDITNFVTFDLGRPLHVYDADKLEGDLSMRLANSGEKCKTLDEKEYVLSSDMIVIADEKKLHGIGGVMGGLDSGCSIETRNVFLEVALFDPVSVTKTGRKLNLQSDARYRFERGIDNTSIDWGVDKATELILKLCGGEVSKITKSQSIKKNQKIIDYDFSKTKTLGGIDISIDEQKSILQSLGFSFDNSKIKIPFFRPDIDRSADIVEEIVRIYGYDKIKPVSILRDTKLKKQILSDQLKSFYKSKRIIASRGYYETVTWSFISNELSNIQDNQCIVRIKNPISNDLDTMRPSIFPNLLNAINMNISRLFYNGKLFEVGPQFFGTEENEQSMVATGIIYGSRYIENWNDEKRIVDAYDIKSDTFFILSQLNVPVENLLHENSTNNYFHPGKSAQLKIGKNIIAQFGEIHPYILQKFEIKTKVNGFEIYLDELSNFQTKKISTKKAYHNNVLQAVERDFAFLFPQKVRAEEVIKLIKSINKQIMKKVTIFDVFEGNKLPEGTKSIAFKIILQPVEKTFTDNEIEKISDNIIDLISKNFEGKLRQ
ncbi:MAG: Phenylalanine--tRNA ligase beta subunit [Alphaproteobacteria bacterium MarineAlpha5_Bin8]|nr:MAG: Phenylalanine--tRNA ligase beta subunit [Alphaproteobacteria bacterium MarineAlpha5_Bin7]PPR48267.1 MAG: Phenylalanine--tRNA ligase beta subunit [Alphaproteobacteria bacterium MarineAlpha5_Bin8]PPR55006.1 MAG: Phenylalanine--tRNA ligase beta subunit [Alphaproteobacteria bacterium MarineAlpha5_Bin6]|tara:strand:+ start:13330 stop:15717 length:2388 start_codon:yes stop_codon:yes gene_type:complete